MKKVLPVFMILLLMAIVSAGCYLFVLIFSFIFNTNDTMDLGIIASEEDLNNARNKLEDVNVNMISDYSSENIESVIVPVPAAAKFTSHELTALLSYGEWQTWPVKDCQVRINQDGNAEASGMLLGNSLADYAASAGCSRNDLQKLMDAFYIKEDTSFYIKCSGVISSNQVNLEIQKVKINGLLIPAALVKQHQKAINVFVENGIKQMPEVSIDSMKIKNGHLRYEGTLPSVCPHWSNDNPGGLNKENEKIIINFFNSNHTNCSDVDSRVQM